MKSAEDKKGTHQYVSVRHGAATRQVVQKLQSLLRVGEFVIVNNCKVDLSFL